MDVGNDMTDAEIGKTAREIAEKGYTAKVRLNKTGIIILKEKSEIVKREVFGNKINIFK